MKKLFYILIVTVMIMPAVSKSQLVNITDKWKFSTGDNPEWSKTDFDDKGWKMIGTGLNWESQGYEGYDGYAWYRVHVFIPASLKKTSYLGDSLRIRLGRIDDCDEVYLNGTLIGSNAGKTCDKEKGLYPWDCDRNYLLSVTNPAVIWDGENLIAVRVFDQGGPGGMYEGKQTVSMVDLADYIEYSTVDFNFGSRLFQNIENNIVLKNTSIKYSLSGKLYIKVISLFFNNVIFSDSLFVEIKPGASAGHEFILPHLDNMVAVYTFAESKSGKLKTCSAEVPYILTPEPSSQPKINGAKVFGVRPGSDFLYTIAVTGERPMYFKAENLPAGLSVDEMTGRITGKIIERGEYKATLFAENKSGRSERELKIVCGDKIALTPPMGWNSWNCWGLSVSDEKVRQSADAMVKSRLLDHGWTYINIDDGWELKHENGKIQANEKFPDMKSLCEYIHSLGLKTGIYSSPGPKTCGNYEGSYTFEEADARSYADWGIDYLKYDWCSYSSIATDTSLVNLKKPYFHMRDILKTIRRDIVFSLCQYGMGEVWEWGTEAGGNTWRTTGDIQDSWKSMSNIGFSQNKCSPYAGPGHWNDPDMLVVGKVGWGPALHNTQLTVNEQYTHISLWALLSAPLLIGCDLSQLDPFTLNLLTNDEVIDIDQDPLGKQAKQALKTDKYQIWIKDLQDGSIAVGVFNTGNETERVLITWQVTGLKGQQTIRDVWRQKNIGIFDISYKTIVAPHGVMLLKFTAVK
jgi:hypothetical protein